MCRHDTTPELWQETYLSAILRAVLYGDDPTYWLEAYRRLDPITTKEGEIRFLEAAEALFSQGRSLIQLLIRRFLIAIQVGRSARIPRFR